MASLHTYQSSKQSEHLDYASGYKRASSEASDKPVPLMTSKLGNQQQKEFASRKDSVKKPKMALGPAAAAKNGDPLLEGLIAKLSEHSTANKQRQSGPILEPIMLPGLHHEEHNSSNSSIPSSPESDTIAHSSSSGSRDGNAIPDAEEVLRLKQQLAAAERKMAQMDQELTQTRQIHHTLEHAMGPPSEVDPLFRAGDEPSIQDIRKLQNNFNASTRPLAARQTWPAQDESRQDVNDATAAVAYGASANIWGGMPRGTMTAPVVNGYEAQYSSGPSTAWNTNGVRPIGNVQIRNAGYNPSSMGVVPYGACAMNQPINAPHGPLPLRLNTSRGMPGFMNDHYHMGVQDARRNNPPSRPGSAFDLRMGGSWASYAPSAISTDGGVGVSPPLTPLSFNPSATTGIMVQPAYSRVVGTRLSPTANEFNQDVQITPWNSRPASETAGPTYIAACEPLNYRRLLERNASGDWSYIVDKIVCSNDQQASIFLQQKLKNSTHEHKYEIVQAIIQQAYPLMVNRFGNFLVQRCFEHGTSDQVIEIASAIRGRTLELSMDAFGCHVIQKAFDAVPESYKAIMVHELLRNIPETVVHRYACHVWQKLFELRWSDSPPQIMKYVNEALRGMWHEVALGETGSLVVQNIFENCLEEDKRPCIDEVMANIDNISHGQFGNWCIQHICEHGAPADKARAIDHILRLATEYSMDQYASKVIEKCLKIGGDDFLNSYLDRVGEARRDRPRMPLIDIAGDQFGNYLIQWILTHANPQSREIVAAQVRKHMVSLRGSKYGSRVAMLCNNPMSATRPGPPAGMQLHRGYNNHHNGSNGGMGNGNMASRQPYGGGYR